MKKSSTKVFWLFVGISIAIHTVLFVAWFNPNSEQYAVTKKHTINIKLTNNELAVKNKNSASQKIKNQPLEKEQVNHSIFSTSQHIETINNEKKENKGDYKELHKLLHSAINRNKHYPLSALRLNREGTVRLTFNLLSNGSVNNLKVSNSSGYNSLDKAALKAIKNIQPFKPARQYIASMENFLLDIKFQL